MSSDENRHILVTGATGFIGAHIVDALLHRGIKVTGTARSEGKASEMEAKRSQYLSSGKFKVLVTGDLTIDGAFDDAVKDVDGIIHAASPVRVLEMKDFEAGIISPAIKGTQSILDSASKSPSVKRIVITSSFASVADPSRGLEPGFTYTSTDWNPVTHDQVLSSPDPFSAYIGAKKLAELEAWNYVKEKQTNFDLVTLCPPLVVGPWVHPLESSEDINNSNRNLRNIVRGKDPLPISRVPAWVDVRDLAVAHVEAILRPEAGMKRYIPSSPEKFTYQMAADIIRSEEEFQGWALGEGGVTRGDPGAPVPKTFDVDGEPTTTELGVQYRTWKECVIDTVRQIRATLLQEAQ